jgi:hypothetical protein
MYHLSIYMHLPPPTYRFLDISEGMHLSFEHICTYRFLDISEGMHVSYEHICTYRCLDISEGGMHLSYEHMQLMT